MLQFSCLSTFNVSKAKIEQIEIKQFLVNRVRVSKCIDLIKSYFLVGNLVVEKRRKHSNKSIIETRQQQEKL
jgi:hypothetical protein